MLLVRYITMTSAQIRKACTWFRQVILRLLGRAQSCIIVNMIAHSGRLLKQQGKLRMLRVAGNILALNRHADS